MTDTQTTSPAIDYSTIPRVLRERRQWVLWRAVERGDKPTKEPAQADGRLAKSNDASTWTTFATVAERFERGGFDGIGFVFSADDPFIGIDLDGCRDPATGAIADWAQAIIKRFATYAEVSPSETGVKLFCIGRSPFGGRGKKKSIANVAPCGGKTPAVEIYDRGRYFAVTGRKLADIPGEPTDASEALDWLAREHWPERFASQAQGGKGHAPAADMIDLARQKLATIGPAISGQGGHDRTFNAACELFRCRLGRDDAWRLLAEYNETCQPPWTDAELSHKLDDAEREVNAKGEHYSAGGTQPPSTWPAIVPFDELKLPRFPTDALPDVLRRFVEGESHATQTPSDLAALLALAVCSAAIARRVEVEPRPGWREPVNLFVAVLLEPGNRKSAVFADVLRPLREVETELIEASQPVVARAQSERRQAEKRLQKLESQAAEKWDFASRCAASNLAAELAEQVEPALPRLLVDDATVEKLGIMLAEQGGRIASMSPEGGVFDLMAGLYSKQGIPQFGVYLMGHSGDDLLTDRVSRKSVHVERPALTCAYAIQPQVIRGLAENPTFRGRGLLARFLYAFPRSWIGQRQIAAVPVPDNVREAYRDVVRWLATLAGEWTLGLSSAALASFQDWEREIEGMLADDGAMEAIRDWGSKLAGATLRLAAVLHCVEHGPDGCIDDDTITAAITIARNLVPHAAAVLGLMQADDGPDDDARYVLRWIKRHGRREFTKSAAQQHGKRRFHRADDIDPALGELERRGYVRLRPSEPTGPGRPSSPVYDVNPAALSERNTEKRPRYSENCHAGATRPNCQNIQSASRRSACDPVPF